MSNPVYHLYIFRMKKRMSTLMHTHVALIILTACAVLDASCVIGQIIADILIMKGKSALLALTIPILLSKHCTLLSLGH